MTEKIDDLDLVKCDGCKVTMPIDDVGSIMLDEQGVESSDEIYCKICFEQHKIIKDDFFSFNL